jgi:hypothetical protein
MTIGVHASDCSDPGVVLVDFAFAAVVGTNEESCPGPGSSEHVKQGPCVGGWPVIEGHGNGPRLLAFANVFLVVELPRMVARIVVRWGSGWDHVSITTAIASTTDLWVGAVIFADTLNWSAKGMTGLKGLTQYPL